MKSANKINKESIEDKNSSSFIETIGSITEFIFRFFKEVFLPPYEFGEIFKHMDELGVKTLPIVSVTGLTIGLVLSLQTQPVLARFGAEAFLPGTVALSVVRELGPVLTALIFAGRVSSGIGAELGSMRVTEQIDAMEVSAIQPFKFLVITRVLACTFILPLLTIYVIIIAILGGFIALTISQVMSFQLYVNAVVDSLTFGDIIPGIGKTFFFGFFVGIIGAYKGYTTKGGTVGVGKSSTSAVVISSLLILISDVILVKIALLIWPY